ncbi:hypothetical protein ES702_02350 [subsurface metagenome]
MNFETAEKRAIEIFSTAKRLAALAQKGKDKSSPFLSTSIVLSAMAIEAYTNALIWLKIIERDDQQLLEKYTREKKGKRELNVTPIGVKVKEWTTRLTGKPFGSSVFKKFKDLIDLRNKIVHYQIQKLDEEQIKKFRQSMPYHLGEKGKEVKDEKKIEQSIKELFFHDYLADEITIKRAQEAIETAREVMAELNKCYYNFIPRWLK